MTVKAEDRFEVSFTLSIKNKGTGEMVTETKHTDFELDYGSMQAFRQVIIGAVNERTGELGQVLAESLGQTSLRQILGGLAGNMVNRITDEPSPGVIR